MPELKVISVKTLAEFSAAVEEQLQATRDRTGVPGDQNWYRGHGKSDTFVLRPTLYRHPTEQNLEGLLALETELVRAFMSHHLLHTLKPSADQPGQMNTLFYMQHYGVPTRLLDWTNNPYIALYFAASDARPDRATGKYPEGIAVWILDPASWNLRALDGLKPPRGPLNSGDENLHTYVPKGPWSASDIKGMYKEPVAITGGANTQRMLAQRGVFTMFGADIRQLDAIYTENPFPDGCLTKIVVPPEHVASILATLHAVGYTDSVAYPDLHGLALELKRLNGFDI